MSEYVSENIIVCSLGYNPPCIMRIANNPDYDLTLHSLKVGGFTDIWGLRDVPSEDIEGVVDKVAEIIKGRLEGDKSMSLRDELNLAFSGSSKPTH